ncbi:hypothetical protein [Pelotalea chapellei]|uniref:Uncharacterized protein n=1 Tax=Pelotalea chapellei TaxID=44671 RepID=A0ABS5U8P4_9BACT|nr:hypothetical protein [Pelotalea chapellei]MBT1072040.1 hypothetical protein [Pelotalea chapellei]
MLKDMKAHCHLKPGQKGTKRLVEQYGESLLCVRYQYDEQRGVRIKTVELVVYEKSWQPPFRFKDDDIVPIAVAYNETDLREKLRKARAKWDPEIKMWLTQYRFIRNTALESRISGEFMKRGKAP